MSAIWILAGAAVSAVSLLSQVWIAGRQLCPEASQGVLMVMMLGGLLLRLTLVAVVLIAALQITGVVAAIWAVVGMIVMRWLLVYGLHKGKLFRTWLQK